MAEPVEYELPRLLARRQQGREPTRLDPGELRVEEARAPLVDIGDLADDDQIRPVGAAERVEVAANPDANGLREGVGQHDLAGQCGPAAHRKGQPVHRPAGILRAVLHWYVHHLPRAGAGRHLRQPRRGRELLGSGQRSLKEHRQMRALVLVEGARVRRRGLIQQLYRECPHARRQRDDKKCDDGLQATPAQVAEDLCHERTH